MLKLIRHMKITYFLEVVSSWCHWAEPAWSELKERYQGRAEFHWKIAQMTAEAYPASQAQCDWFYRRSGTLMRSPYMLNSNWFDSNLRADPAPNLVAEAAKDFGVTGDTVRLAIAHAAVREGKKVGRWEVVLPIAAQAGRIDPAKLEQAARSAAVAARCQASTDEFNSLQVDQRPTFLLENKIGDRVVFSGLARVEPLAAAVEAMLADEEGYASYAAHFGPVPPG